MTDANVSDAVEAPYVSPDVRAFLDFLNAQEGPKMHELPADATRAMMLPCGKWRMQTPFRWPLCAI